MPDYPNQPYGQPPYGQYGQPQQQQQYGQPQYSQQYPQPYGQAGWGAGVQAQAQGEGASERLAFIKKVYALFAGSVAFSAIAAMIALYAGTPIPIEDGVAVPPVVALVAGLPWIVHIGLFLGVVFGASALRRVPRVNVIALFGMAFVLGLLIAPALFLVQLSAGEGGTLSASPVRDAFILTAVMFGGLTGYVTVSKKDFSYLGSFLTMGLLVVLGASILNIFVGSNAFSLAIASVGVLLFGGYVLFDTSRILRGQERDAVGGALQLYLDFLNIFLYLLRILGSRR